MDLYHPSQASDQPQTRSPGLMSCCGPEYQPWAVSGPAWAWPANARVVSRYSSLLNHSTTDPTLALPCHTQHKHAPSDYQSGIRGAWSKKIGAQGGKFSCWLRRAGRAQVRLAGFSLAAIKSRSSELNPEDIPLSGWGMQRRLEPTSLRHFPAGDSGAPYNQPSLTRRAETPQTMRKPPKQLESRQKTV